MNTKDLTDSKQDTKPLDKSALIMDLPEVKDIPGQEHIKVPKMSGMADTTISSDDEEGDGVLGSDDDLIENDESNVSATERQLLRKAAEPEDDNDEDQSVWKARVDSTDEDGDLLNEEGVENDISGGELDVPGSGDDDSDEALGEEDEENNNYSLGGDEKESNNEQLND